MSEIKASEGLVGYARKNGIGAAKAVWQYLQTKSPANVNSEALAAKMKELNKPIITKDDIKRLEAVEAREAKKRGLELQNKDVLEIGCDPGYGAFLLNQLQPKSYIGLDAMNKQVELARKNYPKFKFLIQGAEDLSQFGNESKDVRRASPHS